MNRQARLELDIAINGKLRSLLSRYFNEAGNDIQANKDLYEDLNDQWKAYVQKIRHKKVTCDYLAFEKGQKTMLMVQTILNKDPQADAKSLYALTEVELTEQFEIAKRMI